MALPTDGSAGLSTTPSPTSSDAPTADDLYQAELVWLRQKRHALEREDGNLLDSRSLHKLLTKKDITIPEIRPLIFVTDAALLQHSEIKEILKGEAFTSKILLTWIVTHIRGTKPRPQSAPPDPRESYAQRKVCHLSLGAALHNGISALNGLVPIAKIAFLSNLITGVLADDPGARPHAPDLSNERGESFYKSVDELWDKFWNDWVELLKTTADQDAMAWSQCMALAGVLAFVYWIGRCCLARKNKQSFGWTLLTFVVAAVIVYFEDETKLSQPMSFIIWIFSISLSLTYVRPLVACSPFNGIHTTLVASVALAIAIALVFTSQNLSFLKSMSLGSSFALSFPITAFIWRAVVIQTKWGDRIDKEIGELDPMDVLEYVGSHFSGWVTWVKELVTASPGDNGETAPLESVTIDGADAGALDGEGIGEGVTEENGYGDIGNERIGGEGADNNEGTTAVNEQENGTQS